MLARAGQNVLVQTQTSTGSLPGSSRPCSRGGIVSTPSSPKGRLTSDDFRTPESSSPLAPSSTRSGGSIGGSSSCTAEDALALLKPDKVLIKEEGKDPTPACFGSVRRPSRSEANIGNIENLQLADCRQITCQSDFSVCSDSGLRRRTKGGSLSSRLTMRGLTPLDTNLRAGKLLDDVIEKAEPGRCQSKQHPAQAAQTPGVVVSVWGRTTTQEDCFVPFFSNKPMNFDGDLGRVPHRIGVQSHRGLKQKGAAEQPTPNQDEFFLLGRRESLIWGVLDGHGPDGHDVSHFAQENLPTQLVEHLRKSKNEDWAGAVSSSVKEICQRLEKEIPGKCQYSGTTASIVMVDRPDGKTTGPLRLRCAYLGDSIVVHARRKGKTGKWDWTQLTNVHKPDREDEFERIIATGGRVSCMEGDGARLETEEWSLAMSRSIGDRHAINAGLSAEPELAPDIMLEEAYEHFILACSDGIWDVIPPAQAVNFVGKFKPDEAQLAVERLVSKAQLRWQEQQDRVDDITALLVHCSFEDAPFCRLISGISEDGEMSSAGAVRAA
eukprot:TRINITY_DN21493_c0_g1_i1.p1 TRINITY_DN21493_c0_g1~~TRINITY_DN21493_c0_g1_i1.p1  ORF type:complete len:574 (+),score=90.93 TRINITY_DN21493_c0_g1_i1:73-1722(+)